MISRGINIRYLGRVANLLTQQSSLTYLYEITVMEIVCRTAKHHFRAYIQSVPIHLLAFSASHFLNCFLTIVSTPTSDYVFDEFSNSTSSASSAISNTSAQKAANRKKNKKQQQQQRKHSPTMRNGKSMKRLKRSMFVEFVESLEFANLTSKLLWSQLAMEAKGRYDFDLNW